MHKSITDHHIFYRYIVASLVIVVIFSGIFFKLHIKYCKIQYAVVTQNIKTILYDCSLSDLQINIVNYLQECELH